MSSAFDAFAFGGGFGGNSAWNATPSATLTALDDEEEPEESQQFFEGRDALIFLIDVSERMIETNSDGEKPLHLSLKIASLLMRHKLIVNDNSFISVILYNSAKTQNAHNLSNIFVLHDLDECDPERVLEIEKIYGEQNYSSFGHGKAQYDEVLWVVQSVFQQCKHKIGSRRLFLFTDEDNPTAENEMHRARALTRGLELGKTVEINLYPFLRKNHAFDPSLFYADLIPATDEEEICEASSRYEELADKVRKKEYKKRSVGSLPFDLGGGNILALKAYNLYLNCTKSTPTWLTAKDDKPVKSITKYVEEDTAEVLGKDMMKSGFPLGGEYVAFTPAEVGEMKSGLGSPGLALLGFKPREALKPSYNVTHSTFLYPDETMVEGSTIAVAALVEKMLEMGKIAIARHIRTANAAPRFCALLPQKEVQDENGVVIAPCGLHAVFLPFADDLRHPPIPPPTEVDTAKVDAWLKLIKKTNIKHFTFENYSNPSLQRHYAVLEAIALGREKADFPDDDILPPDFSKVKDLFEGTAAVLFPDGPPVAVPAAAASRKRKATEPAELDWDEIVKSEAAVKKRTVADLKAFCAKNKISIPKGAKKADLVDAVLNWKK